MKKNRNLNNAIFNYLSSFLFVLTISATAIIAQPPNDDFANAETLSGTRVLVTRNNIGATKEAGEPNHANNPGGKSVWFKYTAAKSGTVLIGTNRTEGQFDSLLHVYIGQDMSTLTSRGWSNDISSPSNLKSVVSVNFVATRTYYIAVDGASASGVTAEGNFTLDIRPYHPYQSADYDGDGDADLAVYRPSDNTWYVNGSTTNTLQKWGTAGDIPVTMSRSNGRIAPTVFRPSTGDWYNLGSSVIHFGMEGDIPVSESYGGELTSDYAVFRPSTGTWYLNFGPQNIRTYKFGLEGDIPVPGRYSPDNVADLAVYRPSNGVWYILRRVNGDPGMDTFEAKQFGLPGDKPVPGDYDGDGLLDPAIFRPATGTFWVLQSSDNQQRATKWGVSTDIPVTGDFDEDGIFDFAVFRPSEGNWYILNSDSGWARIVHWGTNGDIPMTGSRAN